MTWRLMFAAVLLAVTPGCDRTNGTPMRPSLPQPVGASIVIVNGTFGLTPAFLPATTGTPLPLATSTPPPLGNPVPIPRGSPFTIFNNDNIAHTCAIPGVFETGIIVPGGNAVVTLPRTGTFTFGCTLVPNVTVTIVVV
jgi:hypothetical protein